MKLIERLKTARRKIHYPGHAYNDAYIYVIPLLLPLIRTEFFLNYTQLGLILTGHVGMRSLFSYINGQLGDRYDKRVIIAAGFLFSTLMMAGMYLIDSITGAVTLLLLMGAGVSTFHPLATALVSGEANRESRGLHIGIFEAVGSIGIIMISLTFGLAVSYLGWRLTCFYFSLPGIPLAWAYLRSRKEEIVPGVVENCVSRFYLYFFILGRGVRMLGMGVVLSFLPIYGTDHLGLTAGAASSLIMIYALGTGGGCLLGGWGSDRKPPLLLVSLSTVCSALLIYTITLVSHYLLLYLVILVLGFINGGFYSSQVNWLTSVSTARTRGKIHGTAFLVDGFSATIAPAIFGLLADRIGLIYSFQLMALPVAVSFAFFYRLNFLQDRGRLGARNYTRLNL